MVLPRVQEHAMRAMGDKIIYSIRSKFCVTCVFSVFFFLPERPKAQLSNWRKFFTSSSTSFPSSHFFVRFVQKLMARKSFYAAYRHHHYHPSSLCVCVHINTENLHSFYYSTAATLFLRPSDRYEYRHKIRGARIPPNWLWIFWTQKLYTNFLHH